VAIRVVELSPDASALGPKSIVTNVVPGMSPDVKRKHDGGTGGAKKTYVGHVMSTRHELIVGRSE
jgi:hypothetical protein